KNGVLPIRLEKEKVEYLLNAAKNQPYELTINLEQETLSDRQGFSASFPVSAYWKNMLVNGWDEIEITLQLDEKIASYEQETEKSFVK
ncbi:MAG TPA: 3-isopropylmalate dehydratase small subunit, partial [Bacillus sp. (in: firmicutes)]|nr:3-isopropylmalate dehydratase small subunit [Bacillus sp. (in: firmicutes)]